MDDNSQSAPQPVNGSIFDSAPADGIPYQQELPPSPMDSGNVLLNGPPPDLLSELPPVYEESKSKYIIIGGVVFVVLLGLFLGLFLLLSGNRGGNSTTPVTLTYWSLWEDPKIIQPIIDDYKKLHPNITITYEIQSQISYRQKLIQRSQNGRGPDIFRFHNTWLPELSEVAGTMPKEIMSLDTFNKTFYPVQAGDLTKNGDIFGIPTYIDGLILVYNEEMFTKAGVSGPPTAWIGDLQDIVGKLTVQDQQGSIVTSGIALGTASNIDHFSEIFAVLLLLNGGNYLNLSSQLSQDALQIYREFADKNIWNDTMPNSIQAFAEGKVAMILVPSWQLQRIRGINPDLKIKTAPLPQGLDKQQISIANYWAEGVSKFSQNQVEAWKFLEYLSQKPVQQKMYELQVKTRGIGSVPSRIDLGDVASADPLLAAVVSQGSNYRTVPMVDRTFDGALNDEIVSYIRNAINSATNQVGYSEALKTAENGVLQTLERYNVPTPTPVAQ